MENIKAERARKGITQKQLADVLGLTTSHTIANWESGRRSPNPLQLVSMADFFGCSVDYLLGRTERRA